MSSEEYGKYILYISLYGICAAAASVGASSGVIYNVYIEKEERSKEISFAGFLSSIPIISLICILLFAFSGVLQLDNAVLPLLFIHTMLDVLISAYLLKFRYSYRALWVCCIEIFKAVSSVALSYYFVSALGLGYIGRALGFVFVLIPLAVLALLSFGRSALRVPYSVMARVTANSMPASLSALFLSLGVYLVNIVISITLGKESLAVFSIFNTVATSPVFVITALISAIAPTVQRALQEGDTEKIKDKYNSALSLITPVIMLVLLLSREALSFLAPESYGASIFLILPLALYSHLKLSDQFLSCVLNAKRIYRYSLISNLIFSLSTLAVSLLLLKDIGLFAAGVGMLFGAALSVLHKMLHLASDTFSVIRAKTLLSHFFSVFAFGTIALLLSDYPAARILLSIVPITKLLNRYLERGGSLTPKNI
jgi:O-antigen/teichoic acid export membrane protein